MFSIRTGIYQLPCTGYARTPNETTPSYILVALDIDVKKPILPPQVLEVFHQKGSHKALCALLAA